MQNLFDIAGIEPNTLSTTKVTEYVKTKTMPFEMSKDIKYNKKNISKYKSESNLNQFFN